MTFEFTQKTETQECGQGSGWRRALRAGSEKRRALNFT